MVSSTIVSSVHEEQYVNTLSSESAKPFCNTIVFPNDPFTDNAFFWCDKVKTPAVLTGLPPTAAPTTSIIQSDSPVSSNSSVTTVGTSSNPHATTQVRATTLTGKSQPHPWPQLLTYPVPPPPTSSTPVNFTAPIPPEDDTPDHARTIAGAVIGTIGLYRNIPTHSP